MKVTLPAQWQIIYADPKNWPDNEMRDKLAYVKGSTKTVYFRDKINTSWKTWLNWTRYPIIKQLIRKHEITHAIQFEVYGKTWHVDESGIMSRRGSWAWFISPIVSLFRWDWHCASSRGVIRVYNKRFKK